MKIRFVVLLLVVGLGACANSEERRQQTYAINDFIEVSELETVNTISLRFKETYRHEMLGDYHALVRTADGDYLVTFFARCVDYEAAAPRPDRRRNTNMLAAGEDTIRGCRIKSIFPVDAAQRDELRELGKAPGE